MLSKSLTGLRVIDFTQVAAGPLCTQTLVDLGANVTKIESSRGDLARDLEPLIEGVSISFLALNNGKRSASLDLKVTSQRDAALRLAADADVLVESFRPGVMERLGLGYDDVKRVNPNIIYTSISAYGQRSPWRNRPGVDGVLQAITGLMSVTGSPGQPPCKVQVPIVDVVTGYIATIAVLGALAKRDRGGGGEWIDVSMFASGLAMQQTAFATFFADGEVPARLGSAAPYAAPNEALRCSDGWIMVAAYHPARWSALCKIIGRPALLEDIRFQDLAGRIAHRADLVASLEEAMLQRPRDEWLGLFEAADIICAPINDYAAAVTCEAFTDDLVDVVDEPDIGPLKFLHAPFRTVGEIVPSRCAAPRVGEHTNQVLREAGLVNAERPMEGDLKCR